MPKVVAEGPTDPSWEETTTGMEPFLSNRRRALSALILARMAQERGDEPTVVRPGGISYVRIPAMDPAQTAAFYQAVFGWTLGGSPDEPSFEDGTGHVIGHFMADMPVAREAGMRVYVYVETIDETLEVVTAHGGELVEAPYEEGDLWVATFRDIAGSRLGIWQRGPRRPTGIARRPRSLPRELRPTRPNHRRGTDGGLDGQGADFVSRRASSTFRRGALT